MRGNDMKNKKKILAVMAALVMGFGTISVGTMFAGCGGTTAVSVSTSDKDSGGRSDGVSDSVPGSDSDESGDQTGGDSVSGSDSDESGSQTDSGSDSSSDGSGGSDSSSVPSICSIIFDADGGTFADGSESKEQLVRYGNSFSEIAEKPVREGWIFIGWSADGGDTLYSFGEAATEEVFTLKAVWESENLLGEGTKQSPYLLSTPADVTKFVKAINVLRGEYLSAYYRVEADIDASGISVAPAGSAAAPFGGVFDGNGKTVSGLTVSVSETGERVFAGFFGMTERADIRNLTLENISVTVRESSALDGNIYAGALAGYLYLTNVTSVNVSGSVKVNSIDENTAAVGGISAAFVSDSDDVAYIAVMRGCRTDVAVTVNNLAEKALANSVVGGAVGLLSANSGAVALNNVINAANVTGTLAAGGIAAYSDSSHATVSDCLNLGSVNATGGSGGYCYAGGIVGQLFGDSVVIDCMSLGSVSAAASTGSLESYAGAVVGYMSADDYNDYFTAGGEVVNCHYTRGVSCRDNVTEAGKNIAADSVTASFLTDTLKWSGIALSDGGYALTGEPTAEQYTVTFRSGGSVVFRKQVDAGYVLGTAEPLESANGSVFYDWSYGEGAQNFADYRFYMVVFKDVTLYAAYYDVTNIVGYYAGAEESNGTIVVYGDGTFSWIGMNTGDGVYRYDGLHFLADRQGDELSGEFNADGQLVIVRSEGLSTYTYTFTRYEPVLVGQYIDANGVLLTFYGKETLVAEVDGKNVRYTFRQNGSEATVYSGSASVATLEITDDVTVTVKNSTAEGLQTNAVFTVAQAGDCGDEAFIGLWNAFVVSPNLVSGGNSSSQEVAYGKFETFDFAADGSLVWINKYYETRLSYFYIKLTDTIKFSNSGNMCNFRYLEADGVEILYGYLNSGSGYQQMTLMFRGGRPEAFYRFDTGYSDKPESYVLKLNGRYYVVCRGELITDAVIEGDFELGKKTSIVIGGDKVTYIPVDKGLSEYVGDADLYSYLLCAVGAEEGTYTGKEGTFILDGIGNVTGDYTATYTVKDNKVIITSDEVMLTFDYAEAQINGNVYTAENSDMFVGVYYDANSRNESGSHRLLIEGGNLINYQYFNSSGVYAGNWGNGSVAYAYINSVTIRMVFNQYQTGYAVWLDENNVYFYVVRDEGTSNPTFSVSPVILTKAGAERATMAAFDASYIGTWKNGDSTLVITDESTCTFGSYSGLKGVWNGKAYYFKAGDVEYVAELSSDKKTLFVNGVGYTKNGTSSGGSDADDRLEAMTGTWVNGSDRLEISDDLTVKYNGNTFTAKFLEDGSLYFGSEYDNEWFVTVNTDGTLSVEFHYDDMYVNTKVFTKQ